MRLDARFQTLQAEHARFFFRRVPQLHLSRRAHAAGDDAIHPDAERAQIARQRARHAFDAGLGRLIDREVRQRQVPRHRAQIDDDAGAGRLHVLDHGLRAEEEMSQVHGDAVVPVLLGRFLQRVAVVVGRVVDQDVDPARGRRGCEETVARIASMSVRSQR